MSAANQTCAAPLTRPCVASVDYATDAAIQRTLSVDMAARTVLTVAHRMHTILAYVSVLRRRRHLHIN